MKPMNSGAFTLRFFRFLSVFYGKTGPLFGIQLVLYEICRFSAFCFTISSQFRYIVFLTLSRVRYIL